MVKISHTFFNELATDVHNNENKKWWYNEDGSNIVNKDTRLLTLVISELIEAFEGIRKNLNDDKLTHRVMAEVELADAIIRLLDRMEGVGLDKFRNDYTQSISSSGNKEETFIDELNHIIGMLCHPSYKYDTEMLVYNILDLSYYMGYDVLEAIREKREFNKIREDHSYEARKTHNGKRF